MIGIATGKSQRGVRHIIDQFGLEGVFSTIQTSDDAPSKPHPGMILQAMAETGAAPEDTVMIGDAVFDIDMAHAAGVRVAAREMGLSSVPLLCAREIPVPGALPKVIRVLIHAYAQKPAEHVYLNDAAKLRLDLTGAQ